MLRDLAKEKALDDQRSFTLELYPDYFELIFDLMEEVYIDYPHDYDQLSESLASFISPLCTKNLKCNDSILPNLIKYNNSLNGRQKPLISLSNEIYTKISEAEKRTHPSSLDKPVETSQPEQPEPIISNTQDRPEISRNTLLRIIAYRSGGWDKAIEFLKQLQVHHKSGDEVALKRFTLKHFIRNVLAEALLKAFDNNFSQIIKEAKQLQEMSDDYEVVSRNGRS
jgi:hypothetical protein